MTWFVAIGKSSFAYKFSYTLARREFPGTALPRHNNADVCVGHLTSHSHPVFTGIVYFTKRKARMQELSIASSFFRAVSFLFIAWRPCETEN
jgi:hypothetical protein